MSKGEQSYHRFEELVRELLIANGMKIELNYKRDYGFDFTGTFENQSWVVEVKHYRTARAQLSLIETAAVCLMNNISRNSKLKGILVISCSLNSDIRLALESKFGLLIVDRSDLFTWASKFPSIFNDISSFLEEQLLSIQLPSGRNFNTFFQALVTPIGIPIIDTSGTDLCKELHDLNKGKSKWKEYERLCEKILKYLFPNDLHGWHRQKRTDDGLNRFDYICRIKSNTDFWTFLLDHLNSRYVLFEFKNYIDSIKQGEILTTEKYLLEKGLRRVAIVLSRAGANKNAIAMAQGAMRENGKLILVLDDEKVCKMLHMKERGEDPTDLLFEVADDFLLKLPR